MGKPVKEREKSYHAVAEKVSEWLSSKEGKRAKESLRADGSFIDLGSWTELGITYVCVLTADGFVEGTELRTMSSIYGEIERLRKLEERGGKDAPKKPKKITAFEAVKLADLYDDGPPPEQFLETLKQKLRARLPK